MPAILHPTAGVFTCRRLSGNHLLAFGMNGKPLPAEHGFPLRLIMPGWYGMSQIKWLTRIEVIDHCYEGRHMGAKLSEPSSGEISRHHTLARYFDLTQQSEVRIARVTRHRVGERFERKIAGAARGGSAKIVRVELQIDGGSWLETSIDERRGDSAWLLWSTTWKDPEPAEHILVSRAINDRGDIQPTRTELQKRLISNREDNSQWQRRVIIDFAR